METLVTKLKGVVNNSNLDIFGYFKHGVDNLTGGNMKVNKACTIKAVHCLINGASELVVDANHLGWIDNISVTGVQEGVPAYLLIPKYSTVDSINFGYVMKTEDDYSYCDIKEFRNGIANDATFNLDNFFRHNTHLKVFTLMINNVDTLQGSLDGIVSSKDTLTLLNFIPRTVRTNIPCSMDALGHLYKINDFGELPVKCKIAGSVEAFVTARFAEVHNTAGSCKFNWLGDGGRVTYNGQPIENKMLTTISWDADGNITLQ